MPHRAWWLRDLIPSRHVTFLAGEDGVGKSHLALQWSVASALGVGTVCGAPMDGRCSISGGTSRRVPAPSGPAGGAPRARLADLRGRFLLIPMDDHEATFARPVEDDTKTRTPVWRQFMEACLEFLPELIVIDNDAEMFGGEQDPRQTRTFLGRCVGSRSSASAPSCSCRTPTPRTPHRGATRPGRACVSTTRR